tara:strand:- start:1929 stop:3011 length:1083 start_codon:yes stop_codon:yes gene_type:complete
MNQNKVLFFGPYPDPYTGQSVSLSEVFNNYKGAKVRFDTTRFGNYKILNSIYCLLFLPFFFVFFNVNKVFFTCTRSRMGFVKDFQLLLLCRIFKKKVVNHLHGADLNTFYQNSGYLKKSIKWSYGAIDTTIVLLPSMKEQVRSFSEMKLEVINNSYSKSIVGNGINTFHKKNQVLYLSNLIYSKGIFVLLDAISILLAKNSQIVFKIAGSPMGDEFMSKNEVQKKFFLKSDMLSKKYPNRYAYVGMVKGNVKERLLKESSIFVLPTFYKTEAFPLTIIEAMLCRNVIITTNHNYLKDVVSARNGFLVEKNSHEDLVRRISYLFENQKIMKQIQDFNNKEAKEKYSPDLFFQKMNRLITNL